jgi:hypothetical protein
MTELMTPPTTPYRTATTHAIAEPAPYWNPMENCPLCDANYGFLYEHTPDCEWARAFTSAGGRMLDPVGGTERIGGRWAMTREERTKILALRRRPAPPPTLWRRLRAWWFG